MDCVHYSIAGSCEGQTDIVDLISARYLEEYTFRVDEKIN